MKALYIIRNKATGELWDGEGWSESFADVYSEEEQKEVTLPSNGEWVKK